MPQSLQSNLTSTLVFLASHSNHSFSTLTIFSSLPLTSFFAGLRPAQKLACHKSYHILYHISYPILSYIRSNIRSYIISTVVVQGCCDREGFSSDKVLFSLKLCFSIPYSNCFRNIRVKTPGFYMTPLYMMSYVITSYVMTSYVTTSIAMSLYDMM